MLAKKIGIVVAGWVIGLMCLGLFWASTAQAVEEVKVGAIYPLTGGAAQAGWDTRQAISLAEEIINTTKYNDLNLPLAKSEGLPNLGGAKIKFIVADSQSKPDVGLGEAERLITQEGVVALVGCYHSSVTMTASTVAERMKIPFLTPESSSPKLTQRGFKWFFRSGPHDGMFSEAMFKCLKDLKEKNGINVKTIAILHEDTLYGQDSGRIEQQLAEDNGYDVVEKLQYRRSATSLTSEVQRLKAANPDALFPTSYAPDAILLTKTCRDLDFNPPIVMAQNSGHTDNSFIETMGSAVNGIASRSVYSPDLTSRIPMLGKVNDLFKEYTAKAGKERPFNGASIRSFEGMFVITDAINRAGSTDPEKIREALKNINMPADQLVVPWKGIKFDENGQNYLATGIIVQYQEGQLWTVWPFNVAAKEFLYPIPKWSER
jgi:branched-chain amino acid transport system substrate-binding protein